MGRVLSAPVLWQTRDAVYKGPLICAKPETDPRAKPELPTQDKFPIILAAPNILTKQTA